MRDLIIFDLDGVLIDSGDIHNVCLDKAIKQIIGESVGFDLLLSLGAIPTKEKLNLLKIPTIQHSAIQELKQELTCTLLFSALQLDENILGIFQYLHDKGFAIAIASNCIRKSIELSIKQLGISQYVDFICSNEDVVNPKPHPEMFLKCISHFNTSSRHTLIIEDSIQGKRAAF